MLQLCLIFRKYFIRKKMRISSNDGYFKQFGELFPSKMSFCVFIAYMALFINQGLLVTASKNSKNTFNYNPITVVLLTELLKMIISSCVYLKSFSFKQMLQEIIANKNSNLN